MTSNATIAAAGEPTGSLPCKTLGQWLDLHAASFPLGRAFQDHMESTSYRDLRHQALALAGGFRTLGLGRGDVIAVQLPNGPEFLLCYLASSYIGAVLQPVHMPHRAAEIEPLLRHGKARAMVCLAQAKDHSPVQLMLSLAKALPDLRAVIAVGPESATGAVSFDDLLGSAAAAPHAAAITDDFVLLYTSGTTAAPKGVRVAYAGFLANAQACADELGLTNASVLLSAAPFSHLYGLLTINLALVTGAASVNLPAFTPDGLVEALETYRPTALFMAPAHIATCLNLDLLTPDRLASLDLAMVSGSACPPRLAADLQALMPKGKVCQLWGMSELQVGAFTRPDDPPALRLSCVGRASPGTALRVANGATILPEDAEGELQVRGVSVFDGYLDNPGANAAAFTADGWFMTGDLARMDGQGSVTITGRLKDVINRGGVKFNPLDVEVVVDRHPAVACSAIVPMPDPVLGERACCFVVPVAGAALNLGTLQAWLAANDVAKNRWPERLELIAAMPMTPTRKIRKGELVRLASQSSQPAQGS